MRYFVFILMCLAVSLNSYAQPPTLERVSPFQIDQLDTLDLGEYRTINFNGQKMSIPGTVAWTHRFINSNNRYTILMWDPYSNVLLAWFISEDNDKFTYAGYDSLFLNQSHFYKGKTQLEEPLVPPNNYSDPDSSVTEFLCLDKALAVVRKFHIDWNNKDLSQDSTIFRNVDFNGGPPEHSFYTTGQADTLRNGFFVYRKIFENFTYFTVDTSFYAQGHNFYNNQYDDIPYKISDIATLALDDVTDLFLVIDPESRFIYRNRLGILFSTHERKTHKYPSVSPPYPAHLFIGEKNKLELPPTAYPWQRMPGSTPTFAHIEVDCDAQVWFNSYSCDDIYLIKNAFFPHQISTYTDSDTCYAVDLPRITFARDGDIQDIDGSVKGFLTITYVKGIETYKIKYD